MGIHSKKSITLPKSEWDLHGLRMNLLHFLTGERWAGDMCLSCWTACWGPPESTGRSMMLVGGALSASGFPRPPRWPGAWAAWTRGHGACSTRSRCGPGAWARGRGRSRPCRHQPGSPAPTCCDLEWGGVRVRGTREHQTRVSLSWHLVFRKTQWNPFPDVYQVMVLIRSSFWTQTCKTEQAQDIEIGLTDRDTLMIHYFLWI